MTRFAGISFALLLLQLFLSTTTITHANKESNLRKGRQLIAASNIDEHKQGQILESAAKIIPRLQRIQKQEQEQLWQQQKQQRQRQLQGDETLTPTAAPSSPDRTLSPIQGYSDMSDIPENGEFAPCNVCGTNMVMTNFDNTVMIPDLGTLSCYTLMYIGDNGFIQPDWCDLAPVMTTIPCKCAPAPPPDVVQITTSAPSMDPSTDMPSVAPSTTSSPPTVSAIPTSAPTPVPTASPTASMVPTTSAVPTSDPTTATPTKTPTSATPTGVPTAVTRTRSPIPLEYESQIPPENMFDLCEVCTGTVVNSGAAETATFPEMANWDTLMDLPVLGLMTCFTLYDYGTHGMIPPDLCLLTSMYASVCGCHGFLTTTTVPSNSPTTLTPTMSPSTSVPTSLTPTSTPTMSSSTSVPTSLTPTSTPTMSPSTSVPTPTVALNDEEEENGRTRSPLAVEFLDQMPAEDTYPKCNVCSGNFGPNVEMTNWDIILSIPTLGDTSCYTLYDYGEHGMISPDLCILTTFFTGQCGCQL